MLMLFRLRSVLTTENPRVSDEAKDHAREVLEDMGAGDQVQ
jgi:hypothetical protein